MLVYCYETWADMPTQEQLWLCSEAVSAYAASTAHFYIREDRVAWALLLDPAMTRRPQLDYYV